MPAAVAVRARRDQFGDRRQRAQPLTAPQHVDRGGGVVTQPGGGLVAVAVGQLGDAGQHAPTARRRRRRRSAPAHAAAPRRTRRPRCRGAQGTVTVRVRGRRDRGVPSAQSALVQVRKPVNRASRSAVSTASARDRNGPTARRFDRFGRAHDRRTAETPRRSARSTTSGAGTSTAGCTAVRARPAAAARARPPPGRARTRRGRRRWPARPSP